MGLADVVAVLRADTSSFTAKMAEAKASMDEVGESGGGTFSKLSAFATPGIPGRRRCCGRRGRRLGRPGHDPYTYRGMSTVPDGPAHFVQQ